MLRLLPLLLLAPSTLQAQEPAVGPLTMDDVTGGVRWQTTAERVRWAWDGVHLEIGSGDDQRWVEPRSGEEVAVQPAPEPEARGPRTRAGDDELKVVGAEGEVLALTSTSARPREARLSPDGALASFVENGDLKVIDVGGGETPVEARVLAGRETDVVLEGLLDWVYQEEVYGRGDFQGHWWSPDSRHIAFLELDQRDVRRFPITRFDVAGPNDLTEGVELEWMDYPKAGDPNPVTRLGVADVTSGEVVFVDLAAFPADLLVVRVGWAPTGDVEFVVQNRIQSTATLCLADPATGAVQVLVDEQSDTWVERPTPPVWLADGTFLWMTARSGYRHIEHRAADGKLVRALTSGDWRVRSLIEVDEERGQLWFEGTRDGALGAHVYRVGLDGEGLVCLTPGKGSHSASFNADRSLLIDRFSNITTPTAVALRDGDDGKALRTLASAEVTSERTPRPTEQLTIPTRDGYMLDATVVAPAPGVGGEKPPIFLSIYSGPDAPTVRDRWRVSTWNQFLAQQGVLVLQVNVRTASGRGHAHTSLCYRQLGVQELADLEDAVAHVVEAYGADAARVAISGWSYGGFMSAYALTHSDKFAVGFAGAGVHDWRLYDTIYTERYMSTPQLNPEGYRQSSVIEAAANLNGHLVLQHGTIDDNVHLQNTMLLIDALQEAGKESFELMLYPGARHGVRSPHRMRMVWRVLREQFDLADPAS